MHGNSEQSLHRVDTCYRVDKRRSLQEHLRPKRKILTNSYLELLVLDPSLKLRLWLLFQFRLFGVYYPVLVDEEGLQRELFLLDPPFPGSNLPFINEAALLINWKNSPIEEDRWNMDGSRVD